MVHSRNERNKIMYRTVKNVRKINHARKNGVVATDIHHADTDVRTFFHDLYIDGVMVAVKIGIGLSLFKANVLGAAVHEIGHEVVIDAAPYSVSAPAIASAV